MPNTVNSGFADYYWVHGHAANAAFTGVSVANPEKIRALQAPISFIEQEVGTKTRSFILLFLHSFEKDLKDAENCSPFESPFNSYQTMS